MRYALSYSPDLYVRISRARQLVFNGFGCAESESVHISLRVAAVVDLKVGFNIPKGEEPSRILATCLSAARVALIESRS